MRPHPIRQLTISWHALIALGAVGLGLLMAGAISAPQPASEAEIEAQLDLLRRFEGRRRAATDFENLPPSTQTTGPNPMRLAPIPGGSGWLGLLAAEGALVVFDAELGERQRLSAPAGARSMAFSGGGVWVSGERSNQIDRFTVAGPVSLRPAGRVVVDGMSSIRDVAAGESRIVHVIEEGSDRLISIRVSGGGGGDFRVVERRELTLPMGPIELRRVEGWLIVNCLVAHTVIVLPLDESGWPGLDGAVRVGIDGPIWGFDATVVGEDVVGEELADAQVRGAVGSGRWLVLALGGVEDHPLDRSGGFFGYIDSYLYIHAIEIASGQLGSVDDRRSGFAELGESSHLGQTHRLDELNLSEHGVITPKALRFFREDSGLGLVVTGYGGPSRLELRWSGQLAEDPALAEHPTPPGIVSLARATDGSWMAANPLLDAWIRLDGDRAAIQPAKSSRAGSTWPDFGRGKESRVGELLFFTYLMAPANRSLGSNSRFTCETCHFEGYGDGRIHFTGRQTIHATTKPLLGLFNNNPYFSRALDDDLTEMVHAEFRVAGAGNEVDPWFSLSPAELPWLRVYLRNTDPIGPPELRRSLMSFLMDFSHAPNPASQGRDEFTPLEREGAAIFRDRCSGCHAPRLIVRDAQSEIDFDRWEDLVLSENGPLVWGSVEYQKTGVTPYVHADGARTPSLRRLYKKRPYFTNGSAPDLMTVLEGVRFDGERFYHAVDADVPDGVGEPVGVDDSADDPGDIGGSNPVSGPKGTSLDSLDEASRFALLAFLNLL